MSSLGQDVIYNAVLGLRCILRLSDDLASLACRKVCARQLGRTAAEATPVIAEQVDNTLSAERAYFGMGAATGLVALFGKTQEQLVGLSTFPLVMDQVDHVALLAAESGTTSADVKASNSAAICCGGRSCFAAFVLRRSADSHASLH